MDYLFNIGETVLLDGNKVVEIIDREMQNEDIVYSVRFSGQEQFWKLTIHESRLSTALPGRLLKCECGADSIFGIYNSLHADYCGKYVANGYLRKAL